MLIHKIKFYNMRNFCFDEAFGSNYIHVVKYLYYSFFNLMWLDLSF